MPLVQFFIHEGQTSNGARSRHEERSLTRGSAEEKPKPKTTQQRKSAGDRALTMPKSKRKRTQTKHFIPGDSSSPHERDGKNKKTSISTQVDWMAVDDDVFQTEIEKLNASQLQELQNFFGGKAVSTKTSSCPSSSAFSKASSSCQRCRKLDPSREAKAANLSSPR